MTWWTLLWIKCVKQRPQNTGSVASLQHSRGRNIGMNKRTWRNSIDVVFDGFKLDRWSHWALSVTTQTPAWSRTQVWGEKIMCLQPETISNCQLIHTNTNKHSFWEVVLIEYHNWARWSAYVYDGMIPITLFHG